MTPPVKASPVNLGNVPIKTGMTLNGIPKIDWMIGAREIPNIVIPKEDGRNPKDR